MKKPLPSLLLKQLFTGEKTTLNVLRLQIIRIPSFLFVNHSQRMLRELFGALDAHLPPFSSNERRKSTLPANEDYLAQNQTFSLNQKYMMPKQNH